MQLRTHTKARVFALLLALTLLLPGLRVATQDDGNVLRIHQIVYPDVVDPQKSSYANELAVLAESTYGGPVNLPEIKMYYNGERSGQFSSLMTITRNS